MKQRKRVSRRGAQKRISRLRASGEWDEGPVVQPPYKRRRHKENKIRISMYMDADILAWFKKDGPRWQTRISRALLKVMREGQRSGK
jgi:uncharacterized protein (DUF4415 family)